MYLPGQGVHEYVDFHAPAPLAARDDMWADLVESELRDGFGFALRGRVNDLGAQSVAVPAAGCGECGAALLPGRKLRPHCGAPA